MMMCRTDTEQKAAATNSLANGKQITSLKIKDEKSLQIGQPNLSNTIHNVDKKDFTCNGTTSVKNESENDNQQEDQMQLETVDTSINSVNEQIDELYTFKPQDPQLDSCDFNPEFAVICSFILQFGEKLDLTLNIEQLKTSIEDQTRIDEGLIDLHVKLLKKIRRYFVRDLWERALIRYVSEYSYEDSYELESLGYQKTRPSIKLQLLRRLMDAQFEHDQKFKAAVNSSEDANEFRISPTGRDLHGHTFWHQTDSEGNLRVYRQDRDWKKVCSNITELNCLIEELDKEKDERVKGEPILEPYDPMPDLFPELFIKEETVEEEKPIETKVFKGKRGRNKGRGKKNEPLPVLKEAEEQDSNPEIKAIDSTKQSDNIDGTRSIPKGLSENSHLADQGTVESQVKTTLESLISKVMSSFEYIIRPLSRNSPEQTKKVEIKEEAPVIKAPPKKRATKRDKPKEEVLPRRSSSRIQKLQEKKIAEQEEEIKKMIESNAAKKTNSITSSLDDDSRSRSISSRTNKKRRSESPDEDSKKNSKKRRKKGQSWKRGKGKKKLSWDKDDSDLSSTSSVTESNDDDDFEFEEESFKIEANDLDDEFACEDEETNIEPVIIKRARTARQSTVQDDQGDMNESSIIEEDKPCGRCDKSNDPEWILLCDMCDDGYHTSCCNPPLMIVPDGDWFCPPCEHKMLLTKLRELQTSISQVIEAKERERKKNQRIRQANVKKEPVKAEPTTVPDKRPRDFLNELNEPLALQELDDDLDESSDNDSRSSYKQRPKNRNKKRGPRGKRGAKKRATGGKDDDDDFSIDHKKTRRTYSRRNVSDEDESEDELIAVSSRYSSEEEEEEDEIESEKEEIPKTRRARASVSYRFQEYDALIKSAIQGDSYDEEAEEEEENSERASSPEENCNYGRGKDMATIEALAYQQENGLLEQKSAKADQDTAEAPPPSEPKSKPRKKGRRLNDLDAASESGNTTSDESFQASSATEVEDDDEEMTEEDEFSGESDTSIDEIVASKNFKSSSKKKKKKRQESYESDDSEYQPTRSRRAASKRVSYKESTEDEDSEPITPVKKSKKKTTLSSDEESQASWKSEKESVVNEDDGSTSVAESPEMNADLVINEDIREEVSPPPPNLPVSAPKVTVGPDISQTAKPVTNKAPSLPIEKPLQPLTRPLPPLERPLPSHIKPLPPLEKPLPPIAKPLLPLTKPLPPLTKPLLPPVATYGPTPTYGPAPTFAPSHAYAPSYAPTPLIPPTFATSPVIAPVMAPIYAPAPVIAPSLVPMPPQSALQPQPTSAVHVAVARKVRVENSNHYTSPQTSIQTSCSVLDESFDEIATPLLTELKPRPKSSTVMTNAAFKPEQQQQQHQQHQQQSSQRIVSGDKARDPIRELIQYCSESTNSASMYNSYNQTLSTKNHSVNSTSPTHPRFYEEDDLK